MSGDEHRVAAAPGASGAPSPGGALASLVPLASGLLFAVGLAVAGMTNPAKVIAFLDVTGQRIPWDPALALVMAGAIAVYAGAYWWSRRALSRPLLSPPGASFSEPNATLIDRRLLLGSATFGIGWGLAGYCPGPAIVSLATGSSHAIAFCLAMTAGFGLVRLRR